jgi:hypothetical protein
MRRTALALLMLLISAVTAVAQDRVSLRPGFKPGDESRYIINASVETTVTPKNSDGIGGTSRGELTATVLVRTLSLSDGEVNQEALVEAISFSAGKGTGASTKEAAGKKIEFAIGPTGYLTKGAIPDSPGYQALADLLFSTARWRPAGEVSVGGSWSALGLGHLYTDRLSEIPMGASTVYKLDSLNKGVASIEGKVTLNQNGSSVFDAGKGSIKVSVIASGSGMTKVEVDVNTGRVISGATESRVEGSLINIQPTAAGEKMQPREGALVEASKFSIRLVQ